MPTLEEWGKATVRRLQNGAARQLSAPAPGYQVLANPRPRVPAAFHRLRTGSRSG